jgi:hypothetical protein
MLTVERIEPNYFEVVEGPRGHGGRQKSWTARYYPATDVWHIENRRHEYVQPRGRLGKRLITAIQGHMATVLTAEEKS